MGFEIDEKMRLFVNNNRTLFLNSLPTQLFMEEFPGLPHSTRQRIGCELKNYGSWSANSLLIDSIMRLEDFSKKFIIFCNERGQCVELAKYMKRERSKSSRRQRHGADAVPDSRGNRTSNAASRQRSDGRSKDLTPRGKLAPGHNPMAGVGQLYKTPVKETQGSGALTPNIPVSSNENAQAPSCQEDSSLSGSFYIPSADIQQALEEEHAINYLKEAPEVLSESVPGMRMPNIPPSGNRNTQAQPKPNKVSSEYSGIQCEEDVKKFHDQPFDTGCGTALHIDRNNKPDPHETFVKPVSQSKVKSGKNDKYHDNFKGKKETPYFEVSPSDILGLPLGPPKKHFAGRLSPVDTSAGFSLDEYSEGSSSPQVPRAATGTTSAPAPTVSGDAFEELPVEQNENQRTKSTRDAGAEIESDISNDQSATDEENSDADPHAIANGGHVDTLATQVVNRINAFIWSIFDYINYFFHNF
ncbi:hypothetical protein RRG08_012011 [Elysia crispata]|uniref:Uncharacterized protein n=1 Tax=Elysia crispata TaxID=231223 RepID=A0AAE0Y6E0_9GAST|nr:hypothetical protein RRG08_012011 [Elysia crispata]